MFMDDPMERVYSYAASEETEEVVAEEGGDTPVGEEGDVEDEAEEPAA